MKIAAIITEYNPFHKGHKFQIDTLHAMGFDKTAVAMSGSCVQRGEIALLDKFTRAKYALDCGASLVCAMPFPYSSFSAEGFAKGNMQANIYKPYKLTNPSVPPVYNERQRLLLDVQKYGFAMWDLNLYLNTHPTDRNTMMIFDQYRNAYKRAVEEYQSKYGALSVSDASTNGGYWSWNKCPWPWEGE